MAEPASPTAMTASARFIAREYSPVPVRGDVLPCAAERKMPKFVIERDLPGAQRWSEGERRAVSQQSVKILRELGPQIQWIQSFVTDDKLYCVYLAPDEATIREHARRAGFPANRISAVRELLDPTSAE
jgi:hypothetical protein